MSFVMLRQLNNWKHCTSSYLLTEIAAWQKYTKYATNRITNKIFGKVMEIRHHVT